MPPRLKLVAAGVLSDMSSDIVASGVFMVPGSVVSLGGEKPALVGADEGDAGIDPLGGAAPVGAPPEISPAFGEPDWG